MGIQLGCPIDAAPAPNSVGAGQASWACAVSLPFFECREGWAHQVVLPRLPCLSGGALAGRRGGI
jgi:hypothetical protein